MTALERPNTRPAAIQPFPPSAPAPTAKVRSNSDTSPQDSPPKMQNKPAFHSATDIRATATVTPRPGNSLTSPLAPIEIP
jgi:hypothetical protein